MNKKRIVFLDIDGCLNNNYEGFKYTVEGYTVAIGAKGINSNISLFFDCCYEYGISIIWLTDWREKISFKGLNHLLELGGFSNNSLIGVANKLLDKHEAIKEYIEDNNIIDYCIVDDDKRLIKQLTDIDIDINKFVMTDGSGISVLDVIKIVDILEC